MEHSVSFCVYSHTISQALKLLTLCKNNFKITLTFDCTEATIALMFQSIDYEWNMCRFTNTSVRSSVPVRLSLT